MTRPSPEAPRHVVKAQVEGAEISARFGRPSRAHQHLMSDLSGTTHNLEQHAMSHKKKQERLQAGSRKKRALQVERLEPRVVLASITEFGLTSGSAPTYITSGPNGNLWFTESGTDKIGEITTGGTITQFSLHRRQPTRRVSPPGPTAPLWFTEQGTRQDRRDHHRRLCFQRVRAHLRQQSAGDHHRFQRQPLVHRARHQQDRRDRPLRRLPSGRSPSSPLPTVSAT